MFLYFGIILLLLDPQIKSACRYQLNNIPQCSKNCMLQILQCQTDNAKVKKKRKNDKKSNSGKHNTT